MRHRFLPAVVGLTLGAVMPAAAQDTPIFPNQDRHLRGPLEICDFGAFFVGGVPKLTQYANSITQGTWQQLIIGQMYVQFMIPVK